MRCSRGARCGSGSTPATVTCSGSLRGRLAQAPTRSLGLTKRAMNYALTAALTEALDDGYRYLLHSELRTSCAVLVMSSAFIVSSGSEVSRYSSFCAPSCCFSSAGVPSAGSRPRERKASRSNRSAAG